MSNFVSLTKLYNHQKYGCGYLPDILVIILGALLEIWSIVAVALALLFTLIMSQAPSILLLFTIYIGSISAILINTLCTPQSAGTCLVGYQTAQRGEGAKRWVGRLLRLVLVV